MKKILAVILSMMMILPFCIAFSANAATPGYIYIDDINTYGSNKIGPILVYGNGVSASDKGVNAHAWWNKIIAAFNAEDGSFVVHTVYAASAGDTSYMNVKLAANEIMILTHATIPGSHETLGQLTVGDKLYAYGFNFANGNAADTLSSADDSGTSSVCFTTVEPLLGDDYYGYVAPPEPNIKNIGAKVNTDLVGLRFGTTFKNDPSLGEVLALGTLLIPEARLGSDELTIDSANNYVVNVPARTIAPEDFVFGKLFEDYSSFTYYVTVIGLEGHEDKDIVARSYVTYKSPSEISTVYADAITRNFNAVLDAVNNPPVEEETPSTPSVSSIVYTPLTYANWYPWSDSAGYQKNIFVFASANASKTPNLLCEQSVGFLADFNGIVLEYNSTKGTWVIVTSDLIADGVNAAESVKLGDGKLVIIFHNDAVIGQQDGFNFLIANATVGTEFVLTGDINAIQSVQGAITNAYLSLASANWTPPVEEVLRPTDTSIGTVQSTVTTYTSNNNSTASSGDTDGLSCVLYAPQSSTIGISTYVNLSAIDTTLYTNSDALGKQNIGCGLATDKNVDNAYLYLCLNSTNWSGDYGLIKRLGDNDWEIITSEIKNNSSRWNAYASTSSVTVYFNSDYVYSKWNVMDGQNVYYIKNSNNIKNLQMNLMYNNGQLTYSLKVGGVTIFSVSDAGTISNGKYGRAASITNSGTVSTSASTNYLNLISSTANGRTPAELTNVQYYDSYYYTSNGAKKLTVTTGSLWIYPNKSSSGGRLTNLNGDPIVSCQEVTLTDGRTMDIINIQNY